MTRSPITVVAIICLLALQFFSASAVADGTLGISVESTCTVRGPGGRISATALVHNPTDDTCQVSLQAYLGKPDDKTWLPIGGLRYVRVGAGATTSVAIVSRWLVPNIPSGDYCIWVHAEPGGLWVRASVFRIANPVRVDRIGWIGSRELEDGDVAVARAVLSGSPGSVVFRVLDPRGTPVATIAGTVGNSGAFFCRWPCRWLQAHGSEGQSLYDVEVDAGGVRGRSPAADRLAVRLDVVASMQRVEPLPMHAGQSGSVASVALRVSNSGRDDRPFVIRPTPAAGWEIDPASITVAVERGAEKTVRFSVSRSSGGCAGLPFMLSRSDQVGGLLETVRVWLSTDTGPGRDWWLFRVDSLPAAGPMRLEPVNDVGSLPSGKAPLVLVRGTEHDMALDADKSDAADEAIGYWHRESPAQDFIEFWFSDAGAALRARFVLYAATWFTNGPVSNCARQFAVEVRRVQLVAPGAVFVAHSLGGLVVRAAVKYHGIPAAAIVTLATPHFGNELPGNSVSREAAWRCGINLRAEVFRDLRRDSQFLAELNTRTESEPVLAIAGGPISQAPVELKALGVLGVLPRMAISDGVVTIASALAVSSAPPLPELASPADSVFARTRQEGARFASYTHSDVARGREAPEPAWSIIAKAILSSAPR